jgi:Tripartite tricarboxylate transporter TctB family
MSRRAQENLVAGVLLAFFLGIIVLSLGYSPRSRLVPLPMAVLGAILVTVQLIWQNLRSVDELQVDVLEFLTGHSRAEGPIPAAQPGSVGSKDAGSPGSLPRKDAKTTGSWKSFVAFGMVAVLLAGFLLLGPIPAIFLFTAAYLILTKYSSWPRGLAYAAVFTTIIVVVFGHVLKIPLDRSILLPGIGQYVGL